MIAGNRYHIEQNDLDTWNNNGLETRNSNDLDTRNSNDLDKRNSNDLDTRNIKTVDYVISAEKNEILMPVECRYITTIICRHSMIITIIGKY